MGTWTFENVELHSCVSAVASFQGRPGNVNEGISSAGLHIFSESLHRLGSIKPSVLCTLMQFVA